MVFEVDETEVLPVIFSKILVEKTEITTATKNNNTIRSVNAFLEACPAILRSNLSSTTRRPKRSLQNFLVENFHRYIDMKRLCFESR